METISWRPSLTETSVSGQLAQTNPSRELKIMSSSGSHRSPEYDEAFDPVIDLPEAHLVHLGFRKIRRNLDWTR